MPASAWYMLWQWTIQSPALSASSTIAKDCIGAMSTVSLRRPDGRAKVCPCRCRGWVIIDILTALSRRRCPALTVKGSLRPYGAPFDHPPIGLH